LIIKQVCIIFFSLISILLTHVVLGVQGHPDCRHDSENEESSGEIPAVDSIGQSAVFDLSLATDSETRAMTKLIRKESTTHNNNNVTNIINLTGLSTATLDMQDLNNSQQSSSNRDSTLPPGTSIPFTKTDQTGLSVHNGSILLATILSKSIESSSSSNLQTTTSSLNEANLFSTSLLELYSVEHQLNFSSQSTGMPVLLTLSQTNIDRENNFFSEATFATINPDDPHLLTLRTNSSEEDTVGTLSGMHTSAPEVIVSDISVAFSTAEDCSASVFGCCSDNVTYALDANPIGCRETSNSSLPSREAILNKYCCV